MCRASRGSTISISTAAKARRSISYGDVFLQAEQEYSRFNFEHAEHRGAVPAFQGRRGRVPRRCWRRARRQPASARASRLRPVHQGEPRLQPARRARRDLGDGAAELYPARAGAGEGLRRGLVEDGRRRGMTKRGASKRDQRMREAQMKSLFERAIETATVARRDRPLTAHDNHSGEPALVCLWSTDTGQEDIPDISRQERLSQATCVVALRRNRRRDDFLICLRPALDDDREDRCTTHAEEAQR